MTAWLSAAAGVIFAFLTAVAVLRLGRWFLRNGDEFADFQNRQAERQHGRDSMLAQASKGWIYRILGVEFVLACCGIGLCLLVWITERMR